VLDESVCVLVDPEPESMAQGLLVALCDGDRRARVAAAALRLYETRYSRDVYEAKVGRLLQVLR
jgi:hypothetical protein